MGLIPVRCYTNRVESLQGNILVSSNGTPRLADFGLSKLIGEESSSSSGSGTLRWMAKEMLEANPQASGKELSSRRSKASDIWSMGMTILVFFRHFTVSVIVKTHCNYRSCFLDETRISIMAMTCTSYKLLLEARSQSSLVFCTRAGRLTRTCCWEFAIDAGWMTRYIDPMPPTC